MPHLRCLQVLCVSLHGARGTAELHPFPPRVAGNGWATRLLCGRPRHHRLWWCDLPEDSASVLLGCWGCPVEGGRWWKQRCPKYLNVFQLVFRDQKVYTSGWPIFGLLATAAETVQCLSCKWIFCSSDCWFITCNYVSLMSSTIFIHFLGLSVWDSNPSFWGAMPSNTTEAQLFHRLQGQCVAVNWREMYSNLSSVGKFWKECYHLVRCVQSWTTWCWPHWYMPYFFAWWHLKVFWIVYSILTITVL